MRFLLVSNQGGLPVVDLKVAFAQALERRAPGTAAHLAVLTASEAAHARAAGISHVWCFEEVKAGDCPDVAVEVERLARDYDANWSAVLAAERTFIDASALLGGAGERSESRAYCERLIVDFVRFFETVLNHGYDLAVAQTPDSLMTHVLYKVARHRGVPVRGVCPGWLTESGAPGGFLTADEFLRAPAMIRSYRDLAMRSLTAEELTRTERFRRDIVGFDGNKVFYKATGKNFGRAALSPNVMRLGKYLSENAKRRPEIEYFKVAAWPKLRANVMRLWRKRQAARWLGRPDVADVPAKSVFYPIHFQPEASTLVGGIFYANQIALIEAIAKSLPLGYTLVLKEHPAGRGTRPAWQYRYFSHYPNVMFCDAPSKEIVRACDAVVTITGTIAIEAMALDKPVIMFGDWFYDHAEVLYRCKSFDALPALFRRLLIAREYEKRAERHQLVAKFLLSYLLGLLPAYPRASDADVYAEALLAELAMIRGEARVSVTAAAVASALPAALSEQAERVAT